MKNDPFGLFGKKIQLTPFQGFSAFKARTKKRLNQFFFYKGRVTQRRKWKWRPKLNYFFGLEKFKNPAQARRLTKNGLNISGLHTMATNAFATSEPSYHTFLFQCLGIFMELVFANSIHIKLGLNTTTKPSIFLTER